MIKPQENVLEALAVQGNKEEQTMKTNKKTKLDRLIEFLILANIFLIITIIFGLLIKQNSDDLGTVIFLSSLDGWINCMIFNWNRIIKGRG